MAPRTRSSSRGCGAAGVSWTASDVSVPSYTGYTSEDPGSMAETIVGAQQDGQAAHIREGFGVRYAPKRGRGHCVAGPTFREERHEKDADPFRSSRAGPDRARRLRRTPPD